MSDIGSWEPQTAFELTDETLERLLLAASSDCLDAVMAGEADLALSDAEAHALAPVMTLNASLWPERVARLTSSQLVDLVRFFTLAEARLPGWEAGDKSPVITLAAVLKQRGDYPPDLTSWIKRHSENRFLPYGNLMNRL